MKSPVVLSVCLALLALVVRHIQHVIVSDSLFFSTSKIRPQADNGSVKQNKTFNCIIFYQTYSLFVLFNQINSGVKTVCLCNVLCCANTD